MLSVPTGGASDKVLVSNPITVLPCEGLLIARLSHSRRCCLWGGGGSFAGRLAAKSLGRLRFVRLGTWRPSS